MHKISGFIGRDELIENVCRDLRKGRHVVLTGDVGIGKSSCLNAVLDNYDRRRGDRREDSDGEVFTEVDRRIGQRRSDQDRRQGDRHTTIVYVDDHQAKGQFITITRMLLEAGILPAQAIELPERYHNIPPSEIEWAKIKRHVNRMSIRDLTSAIVPAIHDHEGKIIIAVDDMNSLTPTMTAFWLAVIDKAQLIGCTTNKKTGLKRLWWKMKEHEVTRLSMDASTEIVKGYVQQTGMLVETPDLYFSHVVKQAGGNPQAMEDMLTDSGRERVVDKKKIREMRHHAGIQYVDFTPVIIISTALIVGTRYLAIGLGDTAMYILAGMTAAVLMSARMFLFRGAGKAN